MSGSPFGGAGEPGGARLRGLTEPPPPAPLGSGHLDESGLGKAYRPGVLEPVSLVHPWAEGTLSPMRDGGEAYRSSGGAKDLSPKRSGRGMVGVPGHCRHSFGQCRGGGMSFPDAVIWLFVAPPIEFALCADMRRSTHRTRYRGSVLAPCKTERDRVIRIVCGRPKFAPRTTVTLNSDEPRSSNGV